MFQVSDLALRLRDLRKLMEDQPVPTTTMRGLPVLLGTGV